MLLARRRLDLHQIVREKSTIWLVNIHSLLLITYNMLEKQFIQHLYGIEKFLKISIFTKFKNDLFIVGNWNIEQKKSIVVLETTEILITINTILIINIDSLCVSV